MAKFYAVKNGRINGIFNTWEECKAQVDGYSGAEFKSFTDREAAKAYVTGIAAPARKKHRAAPSASKKYKSAPDTAQKKCPSEAEKNISTVKDISSVKGVSSVTAYTDGSYNAATGEFSYGLVILNGEGELCFNEKFTDPELAAMRNVAGEILGAQAAMRFCVANGIGELNLYYDYIGIEKWCLGKWKTNRTGTIAYKRYYKSIKDKLHVNFYKVKGHSNDKYNDMADMLAKQALGIG